MPTLMVAERPDIVDATLLIRELDGYLAPLYPPESRHGFPVERLLREAVAFLSCVMTGCRPVVEA